MPFSTTPSNSITLETGFPIIVKSSIDNSKRPRLYTFDWAVSEAREAKFTDNEKKNMTLR